MTQQDKDREQIARQLTVLYVALGYCKNDDSRVIIQNQINELEAKL